MGDIQSLIVICLDLMEISNYAKKHQLNGRTSPVSYKKLKTEEYKFEEEVFWHYRTRKDFDEK